MRYVAQKHRLGCLKAAPDLFHRRVEFAFPTSGDKNVRSFIDEQPCRCQPDPTASPGDHATLPASLCDILVSFLVKNCMMRKMLHSKQSGHPSECLRCALYQSLLVTLVEGRCVGCSLARAVASSMRFVRL